MLDDLEKIEFSAFNTLPKKSSLIDKCLHIAERYYSYYAKRPSLSRTLLKESNFIPGRFGELLKTRTIHFIQLVEELMIEAQKKGEIRQDADCELAAVTYFSLFLRFLFSGLGASEFDTDQSINKLRRILNQHMNGIAQ